MLLLALVACGTPKRREPTLVIQHVTAVDVHRGMLLEDRDVELVAVGWSSRAGASCTAEARTDFIAAARRVDVARVTETV